MDKDDLLAGTLDHHAPVAAAGLLLPGAALREPAPGMDGWTRADILAHVAWWNERSVAVIGGARADRDPYPATGHPWDLDARNAQTFADHHERPVGEIAAWEDASFHALVAAIAGATRAELETPGYRGWLGDGTLADLVAEDSVNHYPEHVPHLAWVAPGADLRLHAAIAAEDEIAISGLLVAGAALEDRDADGRTPLMVAVRAGLAGVAAALLAGGAAVDARDGRLDTPFLAAGRAGDAALLALLADAGADPALHNRYGGTALIPACERGHETAVTFLLEHTAVDVNHRNHLGWTGLMEAVVLADGGVVHQRILRALLGHGADPDLPDHDGVTPLAHARRLGQREIAALLEAAGARAEPA
jgi:hypothetical protein